MRISARYADDAGHRKFTEEVYENEYRLMAGAQWQPKAVAWTDLVSSRTAEATHRLLSPTIVWRQSSEQERTNRAANRMEVGR